MSMKAAEIIWNSWKNGKKINTLPIELTPHNRTEAYEIQETLEALSNSVDLRP